MFSGFKIWWFSRKLARDDLFLQWAAVNGLRELPGSRASNLLLSALNSPYDAVSGLALKALENRQVPLDLSILLPLLFRTSPELVEQAVGNILKLREEWVDSFLKRSDARAQLAVVESLGNIATGRADHALIEFLQSPAEEVCERTLSILGERRPDRCVPHILPMLHYPTDRIAAKALETAYKIDPNWPAHPGGRVSEDALLSMLRLARTSKRPKLWRAAEAAVISGGTISPKGLLRVACEQMEDPGIREVAILAMSESEELDDTILTKVFDLAQNPQLPDWLIGGVLRCLANHHYPGTEQILCSYFDRWDTNTWSNGLTEAVFQIAAEMDSPTLVGAALKALAAILQAHRRCATTRELSIVAFKACGKLSGRDAPGQLSGFIRDQAHFAFLNPYFAQIALQHEVHIFTPGTSLALDVERHHQQWLAHLSHLSLDSLIRDIHDSARPRPSRDRDAFSDDLRCIAIADTAKIKLIDAGIDPNDFLWEYDRKAYVRRQEGIHLDAPALARLWNVGRYWRTE